MEKCKQCGFELSLTNNFCPNCGEPITMLAKQKEHIKLHNAGLTAIAKLGSSSDNLQVQMAIKNYLNKSKK